MGLHSYLIYFMIFVFGVAIASSLPIVDLGHSIHQATLIASANAYNFSNIQFATAPLFSKPNPITTFNRTINTGQTPGICAQSTPWWEIASAELASNSTSLQKINETYMSIQQSYNDGNPSSDAELLSPFEFDSRTVQECLTLDVVVPRGIWDNKNKLRKASVIVWIFGGGHVSGDKNSAGDPSTLVSQSVDQDDSSSGVIFVSINYRLGLFGWLSGPRFQAEGGTSNLALYDQRIGLEWVQQNIHRFGGNPDDITVMGESAGAGSIMHHLTAWGGKQRTPFQQAIIQSPAFAPSPGNDVQDQNFQMALKLASVLNNTQVTSLRQLREVPFDILLKVNQLSTTPAYWGSMTWAPVVDGVYVPKTAGMLLKEGLFDRSVRVITGHNSNEGTIFGSPLITDENEYISYLHQLLPNATYTAIHQVNRVLCPPVFNGSQDYQSQAAREVSTITDEAFICNARYINLAYKNLGVRGYYFDVFPGYHAQDLYYTFFNNGGTVAGPYDINITLAQQMQRMFTNFAQHGSSDGIGLPTLPSYGEESTLWSFDKAAPVIDDAATSRCDWWQEAHYLDS